MMSKSYHIYRVHVCLLIKLDLQIQQNYHRLKMGKCPQSNDTKRKLPRAKMLFFLMSAIQNPINLEGKGKWVGNCIPVHHWFPDNWGMSL